MATLGEVKAKLAEYEAAVADRETKQIKHTEDQSVLADAVDAEAFSRDEWVTALKYEHAVEDEFEAMVIAHEPPELPAVG